MGRKRNGYRSRSFSKRKYKTCYDLVVAGFTTAHPEFTDTYEFEIDRTERLTVFCEEESGDCEFDSLPNTCESMRTCAGRENGPCICEFKSNVCECECEGDDSKATDAAWMNDAPRPKPGDSLPCWLPLLPVTDLGVYECLNKDCVKVQDPAVDRLIYETLATFAVARQFSQLACFGVVVVIAGWSFVAQAPAWLNTRRPSRIGLLAASKHGPPWLCECGFLNQHASIFCGVCAALKQEARDKLGA